MARGRLPLLEKKTRRRERRGQRGPVLWRGQLSLTAFLLLTTAVAIYVTFVRMVLVAGLQPLDTSVDEPPRSLAGAEAPRVEFVVAGALIVGLLFALKAGYIVYRAPRRIGTGMIWILCCGGVIGVGACLFLQLGHHRGLAVNRVRLESAMQGALYFVSLVVPLGALVGGYLRSVRQRDST